MKTKNLRENVAVERVLIWWFIFNPLALISPGVQNLSLFSHFFLALIIYLHLTNRL